MKIVCSSESSTKGVLSPVSKSAGRLGVKHLRAIFIGSSACPKGSICHFEHVVTKKSVVKDVLFNEIRRSSAKMLNDPGARSELLLAVSRPHWDPQLVPHYELRGSRLWDPGGKGLSVGHDRVFSGYDARWLECVKQVVWSLDDVERGILLPFIALAVHKMAAHIVGMFPRSRVNNENVFRIVKVAFYVCSLIFIFLQI